MRLFICAVLLCLLACIQSLQAQTVINKASFLSDESPLTATLSTDLSQLFREKMKGDYLAATFTCKMPDSSTVTEQIRINARGKYRRSNCYMPPIRLSFRNTTSPILSPLNTLKLVCACRVNSIYEQLLLKEYLIYKIYNLLTPRSFLARLMQITYRDSKGKKRPFTQYAFLIEDVDAMAKRNGCKEWKNGVGSYESLNRDQMTMLTVFEYMIGNTDWGLKANEDNHNLRLIYQKKDSAAKPYAVPYDFDHSGLVNANYANPNPLLGIERVVQRVYRGFPRTIDELQRAFQVFNVQREKISALIQDFQPLEARYKKEMIAYLDAFYKTINKEKEAKTIFITNARQW